MFPGAHVATQPDRAAVVMASSGAVQTYAELDAAANRLAHLLRTVGVEPGDHVAFCLENHPRYLEIAWGCHYAGSVYTAASSRLTSGELAYILEDCAAKVFITSAGKADQAAEVHGRAPGVTSHLMVDGTIDGYDAYEEAVAAQSDDPLLARVAGTDMLYSSGTTGLPKGVTKEFRESPLETTPGAVSGLLQLLFGFTADAVYLSPAPLYHAAPLRFNMGVHTLGGTSIVMEHFDAEDFLRLIERHRVTHTQVVPTMFVRLLKLPADVRARYDVSSLRAVVHAAAPCPVPGKQQMIEWFGPVIHEYYAG
ncbi:MAG: AMP-binding protein, partial [Actinomycetota bacterium]|nr:AMP-binding protein [Actinomycetota bacterium]